MRGVAWISAVVLCVGALPRPGGAQDSIPQPPTGRPPLQATLLQASDGYVEYETSDSAYVAIFGVYPGMGVEVLYASTGGAQPPIPQGAPLDVGGASADERALAFSGLPERGSEACLFLVASRYPLGLAQYVGRPLDLATALAYRQPEMVNPEAGLAPVLNGVRPADRRDWGTDYLCGEAGPEALALGSYDELPEIPYEDLYYDYGYDATTGVVGLSSAPAGAPPNVSVCVVHRGDASGACRVPRIPGHEPPYRPRGTAVVERTIPPARVVRNPLGTKPGATVPVRTRAGGGAVAMRGTPASAGEGLGAGASRGEVATTRPASRGTSSSTGRAASSGSSSAHASSSGGGHAASSSGSSYSGGGGSASHSSGGGGGGGYSGGGGGGGAATSGGGRPH